MLNPATQKLTGYAPVPTAVGSSSLDCVAHPFRAAVLEQMTTLLGKVKSRIYVDNAPVDSFLS